MDEHLVMCNNIKCTLRKQCMRAMSTGKGKKQIYINFDERSCENLIPIKQKTTKGNKAKK